MTTHNLPIAIIGGGLSGLYTAYLLQQQGIEATVYEARDRLGGRITTATREMAYIGRNDQTSSSDLLAYEIRRLVFSLGHALHGWGNNSFERALELGHSQTFQVGN